MQSLTSPLSVLALSVLLVGCGTEPGVGDAGGVTTVNEQPTEDVKSPAYAGDAVSYNHDADEKRQNDQTSESGKAHQSEEPTETEKNASKKADQSKKLADTDRNVDPPAKASQPDDEPPPDTEVIEDDPETRRP